MKKFISVLFLTLFFLPGVSLGANHYVRDGATGNGSGTDWINAYPTLPSTLVRGDTYYIADGIYGGYSFDDSESGDSYIYIKKAIGSDHGTDTGWNSSYGDGVAEFTSGISFSSDYWVFDGQVGGGPGSWQSGYGFRITTSNCGGDSKLVTLIYADYIDISHVDMEHCGVDNTYRQDIFYCNIADGGTTEYVTVSYCWMHEVVRVMMMTNAMSNLLVEYNYFEHRATLPGGPHGQGISANRCGLNANNVFRYNVFTEIYGTSAITPKDSVQSHFYMYGNLFFNNNHSDGSIGNTAGDTNSYMYTYNNTFVNVTWTSGIMWDSSSQHADTNFSYNNLWYNCEGTGHQNCIHDYNWYYGSGSHSEPHIQNGTGNPFVDMENHDYRLAIATDAGLTLDAPYNQDMFGNRRGNDGVWGRGAFENGSGGGAPNPPRGLLLVN